MGSLLEHPCVTVKEATPSEVRYVLATLEADGGAMLSAGGRHPPHHFDDGEPRAPPRAPARWGRDEAVAGLGVAGGEPR